MEFLSNGVRVYARYIEPTIDEDESGLTDLDYTSIFYDIGAGGVNVVDLPASLSTGGGVTTYSFIIPVLNGEDITASVWATATDTSENESVASASANIRIDRSQSRSGHARQRNSISRLASF